MRDTARRWMAVRLPASLCVLLIMLSNGCRSGGGRSGTGAVPAARADVITAVEISRTNYSNLFDVVQALRSRWLVSRGPNTILGPRVEIQVHLDDVRLGGVQSLRNLSPAGVEYIQWFDATAAAQRWGLGYGHGAIYVSTRPR